MSYVLLVVLVTLSGSTVSVTHEPPVSFPTRQECKSAGVMRMIVAELEDEDAKHLNSFSCILQQGV